MVTKERSTEEAWLGHTQGQVSSGARDAVSWGAKGQEAAIGGRVNAKQNRLSLAGESSQVWRGLAWAEKGEEKPEGGEGLPSYWGGGERNPATGGNIIWAANVQKTEKNKQQQKKLQCNTRLYQEESTWAEKKNGRETWAPKGKPRSWVTPKKGWYEQWQ